MSKVTVLPRLYPRFLRSPHHDVPGLVRGLVDAGGWKALARGSRGELLVAVVTVLGMLAGLVAWRPDSRDHRKA